MKTADCYRLPGLFVGAMFLIVAACTEPTTRAFQGTGPSVNTAHAGAAITALPEIADSIYEVRLNLARNPVPAELSDDDLVSAVRAGDSIVMIGLKPATARPTRETGIITAMSRSTALALRAEVLARGAVLVRAMRTSSTIIARIPPELAPALRRLPTVNYIVPRVILHPGQSYTSQDTTWGVWAVGAPYVWSALSNAGTWASITMLDNGVDSLHRWDPNLDGPENLYDCLYIAGTNVSCYQDADPQVSHGSLVAGVMSGRNNAYGYVGVAYNPYRFSSINVCSVDHVNHVNNCPNDAVASALDWTASNGYSRQIVNISLGSCQDPQFAEFVQRSLDAGNLLVAMAGNADCAMQGVTYPAKYAGVIAVSGTMENLQFANGQAPCVAKESSRGPQVALTAPFWTYSTIAGGNYAMACGTSYSAPFVSAAAALVWSQNPTCNAGQITQHLKDTATHIVGQSGWDPYGGYGFVSAYRAVLVYPLVNCGVYQQGFTVSISGPNPLQPGASCQFTAQTVSGTAPFSFAWTQDGNPAGDGTMTYYNTGSYNPLNLGVTATDANGLTATAVLSVNVDYSAPSCNGQ